VRLFGFEICAVLLRFVLLALFPSRSVDAVFWLCIILTQNSNLTRCSDTPSCCADSIRWVTSEVCQTTLINVYVVLIRFLPLDEGLLADVFDDEV
jgi:hypothetical protein